MGKGSDLPFTCTSSLSTLYDFQYKGKLFPGSPKTLDPCVLWLMPCTPPPPDPTATAAHRPYSPASLSLIRFQLLRALPSPQSQPPHQSQQVSAASPLFFNIDPYFPSLDHCPSPLHSHTSLALEGASPAIPGTLLGPLGHCSQCPQHITKIATTCHMLDLILRTLQEETHLFLAAIPGVRSYFHYHFTDGKVPGTE